jgi:hypothetical protein
MIASGPISRTVSPTARSTSSQRLTSAAMKRARPPRPLISSATVLPPSASTSTTATGAPAAARPNAMARPMPEPPPVTSALPVMRVIARLLQVETTTNRFFVARSYTKRPGIAGAGE